MRQQTNKSSNINKKREQYSKKNRKGQKQTIDEQSSRSCKESEVKMSKVFKVIALKFSLLSADLLTLIRIKGKLMSSQLPLQAKTFIMPHEHLLYCN